MDIRPKKTKRISAGTVATINEDAEDAYEPLETVIRENQTTVEIEVEKPYTLLTNGEKLLVDLKTMELPASYEYFSVPKLDPSAFLIAQVTDWE
ncbi:hypothetical protein [Mariniradius saccharolyticus]|uniref:hypothetical protein n=1 Tax=Mariniradius saccharolyticus TaxID=1245591 RepID=UPI000685812E|nr:hypothetical protein [Mariniradius saccharolyticus]